MDTLDIYPWIYPWIYPMEPFDDETDLIEQTRRPDCVKGSGPGGALKDVFDLKSGFLSTMYMLFMNGPHKQTNLSRHNI